MINFCAYFRHLCIIEKRRPPCAELLVSYGSRYWAAYSQRDALGSPQRCPTDRPTDRPMPAMASRLLFSAIRLCHFREILPNILVNSSTQGCPWSKILSPKILFDHGEYVSHNFACLSATFFVRWGVLRGQKSPLGGSQRPNFQKRIQVGPWSLLTHNFSLIGRKLLPVAFGKIRKRAFRKEKQTEKHN